MDRNECVVSIYILSNSFNYMKVVVRMLYHKNSCNECHFNCTMSMHFIIIYLLYGILRHFHIVSSSSAFHFRCVSGCVFLGLSINCFGNSTHDSFSL